MSPIALVSVTFNSSRFLDGFLSSCAASEVPVCLWAIDNVSSDDTVQRLRDEGRFRVEVLVQEHNLGVAAGNNVGIRAAMDAGCEYIVILNNDTEFGPDLFARLVDSARRHGERMISPQIVYLSAPDTIWYTGADFARWKGYGIRSYFKNEPLSAVGSFRADGFEFAPACCLMLHRSVFDEIGLMDETFFVYSDDQDFLWRAARRGLRVFVDREATLLHAVGGTTGGLQSEFTAENTTFGRLLFIRKHLSRLEQWCFGAGLVAWFIARSVLRRDPWRLTKARWRGFRGALKVRLPE